jgi:hypothetical protein
VRARGATIAARIERALERSGDASLREAVALLERGADPHIRMHTLLDQAERLDADAAVARCEEVERMAAELEFAGVALRAGLLKARALLRAGAVDLALGAWRALHPRLDLVQPADMTMAEAWWIAAQVCDAAGEPDDALFALARGAAWVRETALPHVPAPFRESFLVRNAVNRALLAAADRRFA